VFCGVQVSGLGFSLVKHLLGMVEERINGIPMSIFGGHLLGLAVSGQ